METCDRVSFRVVAGWIGGLDIGRERRVKVHGGCAGLGSVASLLYLAMATEWQMAPIV